jgi:hypothetical protein
MMSPERHIWAKSRVLNVSLNIVPPQVVSIGGDRSFDEDEGIERATNQRTIRQLRLKRSFAPTRACAVMVR